MESADKFSQPEEQKDSYLDESPMIPGGYENAPVISADLGDQNEAPVGQKKKKKKKRKKPNQTLQDETVSNLKIQPSQETEPKKYDEITRTDGANEPQDMNRDKSGSFIDFHQQPNEDALDDEVEDDFEVREEPPESIKQKVFERIQQREARLGAHSPMAMESQGTQQTEDAEFQKGIAGGGSLSHIIKDTQIQIEQYNSPLESIVHDSDDEEEDNFKIKSESEEDDFKISEQSQQILKLTVNSVKFLNQFKEVQECLVQIEYDDKVHQTALKAKKGSKFEWNEIFYISNYPIGDERIQFLILNRDSEQIVNTFQLSFGYMISQAQNSLEKVVEQHYLKSDDDQEDEVHSGNLKISYELIDSIPKISSQQRSSEGRSNTLGNNQSSLSSPLGRRSASKSPANRNLKTSQSEMELTSLNNQKYVIDIDNKDEDDLHLDLPDHTPHKLKKRGQEFTNQIVVQDTIYDESEAEDKQSKRRKNKKRKKKNIAAASDKMGTSVGHGQQTKKGPSKGIRNRFNSQDQESGEDFYEPLSYKKLSKQIEIHHPCDPDTKKKLQFKERISVKDYESKMMDVCFCYAITQSFKRLKKYIKKRLRGEKETLFVKPVSMQDIPSSGSSSSGSAQEDDPRAKGLTVTAQNLGEGSTLYLQSMKTFALMMGMLTIINLPLMIMFASVTDQNDYSNLTQTFKYFTLGNFGQLDSHCDFSKLDLDELDNNNKELMKPLSLDCGDNSYITSIKQFGLLYKNDKRINSTSNGESMCYAVLNPKAEPMDLSVKEKEVEIREQGAHEGRQMRGGIVLADVVKVMEYSEEEQQEDFENIIEGRKLDENEDLKQMQEECIQCIEQETNDYCVTRDFEGDAECCSSFDSDQCSNDNNDRFCAKNIFRNQQSDQSSIADGSIEYKKAFCPNLGKCSEKNVHSKVIELYQIGYLKEHNMESNTVLLDGEQCSYWIKAPEEMKENDYINIKISKSKGSKVTIMIVKEDMQGNINYQPGMTFNPIDGKFFSFFLQKLQYQDNLGDDTDAKYTIGTNTTSYSMMILVEGQNDPDNDSKFRMIIQPKEGFIKPIDENHETEEEKLERYTQEPIWNHILALGPQTPEQEESLKNEELTPNITKHNIDSQCFYDPEAYTVGGNMFKTKTDQKYFTDYFNHNCLEKQSCEIDASYKMGANGVIAEEFSPDDLRQYPLNILPRISDHCLNRIKYKNITSSHFMMVVGCREDFVKVPVRGNLIHKEQVGVLIVSLDIASILVMTFFFYKLKEINNEFLDIMDDMTVQMKDFSIKIDNVILDRYTQDSRVLRLKLWFHMFDILKSKKTVDNSMEVVDINLSLYTQPSIQCVFRMQEIQLEINHINNNIMAGMYKEDQAQDKLEEIKTLKEKLNRFRERYKQLTQKKDKSKTNTQKIPKSQRIQQIQYVFVVFKNCLTNEVCLEMFQKDSGIKKLMNSIIYFNTPAVQRKLFCNREMDVVPALEPDEIIWDNLLYSKDDQKFRGIITSLVSCIFLVATTVFTIYIGTLKQYIEKEIPEVSCPVYFQPDDPNNIDYKLMAYKDFFLPEHQQEGLMGCYCQKFSQLYEPWTLFTRNFLDVQELLGQTPKKRYFCLELRMLWLVKAIVLSIVALSAVLINGIISNLFKVLSEYMKKHTKVEEQSNSFRSIFLMEFSNMGLIALISSMTAFAGINDLLLGFTGLTKTNYPGFSPDWYMDTGRGICFFIFMSSFVSNSADLREFVLSIIKRFHDRSFSMNLKKDPEDEDDDEPNTKKKIQGDLEQLYMGKVFQGEKAYSRMMSTLFVILVYSSGMPILYLIGFVFYLVTYYIHKMLIVNYYQKSRTLTRTIPLFSVEFLKLGLIVHIFGAFYMLTNPKPFMVKQESELNHSIYPDESINTIEEEIGSDGLVKESFFDRLRLFHQKVYIIFLFSFAASYATGKTVYGLTIIALKALWNMTKLLFNLIQVQWGKLKKRFGKAQDQEADKSLQENEILNEMDELFDMSSSSLSDSSSDSSSEQDEEVKAQKLAKIEARNIKKQKLVKKMEEKRIRDMEARRERPDYSENIYNEFDCENLSNFYDRAKKELAGFRDLFNLESHEEIDDELLDPDSNHPMRIVFQEICFMSRITSDQVEKYQKFLVKRIKDIESSIDHHFNLIKQTLINDHKEYFERERKRKKKADIQGSLSQQLQDKMNEKNFLDKQIEDFDDINIFTYEIRMQKLIQHYDSLILADKARKENRNGVQEICRMTGSLTQSYFIFDSQNYKVARKIYYGIDDQVEQDEDDDIQGILNKKAEKDSESESSEEYDSEEERKSKKSKSRINSKRSSRAKN